MATSVYNISEASGTKETGTIYPQIQNSIGGNYWNDGREGSVQNLKSLRIPPDKEIEFGTLVLNTEAKFTDLLSTSLISSSGLLLSTKAIQLIEKLNLGSYQLYPVTVQKRKRIEQYYWLHHANDFSIHIDYYSSVFVTERMTDKIQSPIQLTSFSHLTEELDILINKWKTGKIRFTTIKPKSVELNSSAPPVDLFCFGRLGTEQYISENLKNVIKSHALTGIDISKSDIYARKQSN